MNDNYLPETIRKFVATEKYTADKIGESDSEVRIYDNFVLKIQPQSPETDNEYHIVKWLSGRLPVPSIPAYEIHNGLAYTLMTKAEGKMLCDIDLLQTPELVIELAAKGLKMLWETDVHDCPCSVSRLSNRLKAAEYNVAHGLVDIENTGPEAFGKGGFKDPRELLEWLKNNRPPEDIVLTHGDYCLPNIFANGDRISGFIDLGKVGPADRWQDIAIAIRSLDHNFDGRYFSGEPIFDFKPQMFLDALGVEMNEEKYRYYYLLDELF
jgi:kanamycin kinase/aminoglycoside 3'-phosphotransferase-3